VADEALKERFDVCLCVQCGKCTGGCPVARNSALNIRKLVREAAFGSDPETSTARDMLWSCTTCSLCRIRCPKGVQPVDLIVGMRGLQVEGGQIPRSIQEALEGVYVQGNPWGRSKGKRTAWAENLALKDLSGDDRADVLYFVGCAAAYDDRVQHVARALTASLGKAGIDVGTLGNRETCCGNEVKRMGEEGLFEMLVESNLPAFHKADAETLVTTSPHCYNVLKNEYPDVGKDVLHYTQLLGSLIDDGRLTFDRKLDATVVYHDPCFLGKHNDVYDAPRRVLQGIPGLDLKEFSRCRERSLCCEGGGGRMWFEADEVTGDRSSHVRVTEAVAMGATILATACPFCLLTFEDAAKTTGHEETIRILDVAELVGEALGVAEGAADDGSAGV
jgi:Fe-S oxidoreductase